MGLPNLIQTARLVPPCLLWVQGGVGGEGGYKQTTWPRDYICSQKIEQPNNKLLVLPCTYAGSNAIAHHIYNKCDHTLSAKKHVDWVHFSDPLPNDPSFSAAGRPLLLQRLLATWSLMIVLPLAAPPPSAAAVFPAATVFLVAAHPPFIGRYTASPVTSHFKRPLPLHFRWPHNFQ